MNQQPPAVQSWPRIHATFPSAWDGVKLTELVSSHFDAL